MMIKCLLETEHQRPTSKVTQTRSRQTAASTKLKGVRRQHGSSGRLFQIQNSFNVSGLDVRSRGPTPRPPPGLLHLPNLKDPKHRKHRKRQVTSIRMKECNMSDYKLKAAGLIKAEGHRLVQPRGLRWAELFFKLKVEKALLKATRAKG